MTSRLESIQAYAERGISQVQVCRELGVSQSWLSQFAKRNGIKFRHATWARATNDRADAMAALYRGGLTLQQIGVQYGVTRERVRQLMTKYHGVRRGDGGQQIGADQRRADRQAKKDARCLAQHGCTCAQYRTLLGKPRSAFTMQRSNAKTRGLGWELNLWQWWTIWQESGHWQERGRGQGYGMCRNGDEGPYAVGNVFIAPCFVNSREQPRFSGVALPIGVRRRKAGFVATRKVRGVQITTDPFPTISQAAAAYWTAGAAPVIGAPG